MLYNFKKKSPLSSLFQKILLKSNNIDKKYIFKIKKFISLSSLEKIYIQKVLNTNKSLTKIAKILNISRSTLYRKIKQYNLKKNDI